MGTIQAAGKYYSRASIKCKIAVPVTTVGSDAKNFTLTFTAVPQYSIMV